MSVDMMNIISTFLEKTYELLNTVVFPGTGFSILQLMITAFFLSAVISILKFLFMLPSGGGAEYGTGGNNSEIKVDDKRKNDTK